MADGSILVAFQSGVAVVKLQGDVRLTLCTALDQFLEGLFKEQQLTAVLIDAGGAECVDSTTLGLLAKLALYVTENFSLRPILYTVHPTLNRQFETMGFAAIYEIRHEYPDSNNWPQPEETLTSNDGHEVQETVLQAHKTLMSLNEKNQAEFANLVAMLEQT